LLVKQVLIEKYRVENSNQGNLASSQVKDVSGIVESMKYEKEGEKIYLNMKLRIDPLVDNK